MASAFGKLAKTVVTKPKKSDKVIASVSEQAQTNIDTFVENKAKIAQLTGENKTLEEIVIEEVYEQQRTMAIDSGEYVKTFSVPGKTATVTYVTTDRFSVPQDAEVLAEVKKLIGAQKFNAFFITRQTISLKENVVKDEDLLNKISDACEKAGLPIADIFDVTEKTFACDGLDEKQFQIPVEKLPEFRAMVKQTKASLR
jgi:hypothetical protein